MRSLVAQSDCASGTGAPGLFKDKDTLCHLGLAWTARPAVPRASSKELLWVGEGWGASSQAGLHAQQGWSRPSPSSPGRGPLSLQR